MLAEWRRFSSAVAWRTMSSTGSVASLIVWRSALRMELASLSSQQEECCSQRQTVASAIRLRSKVTFPPPPSAFLRSHDRRLRQPIVLLSFHPLHRSTFTIFIQFESQSLPAAIGTPTVANPASHIESDSLPPPPSLSNVADRRSSLDRTHLLQGGLLLKLRNGAGQGVLDALFGLGHVGAGEYDSTILTLVSDRRRRAQRPRF